MSSSTRSLHGASSVGSTSLPTAGLAVPSILLALSGMSALVFQIIWIKQLSLIVGVEVHAIAVAVSAFFFGLAVGGWWLGRRVDRIDRPLRLYMWIEIGIAIVAVVVTGILAHGALPFVRVEQSSPFLAWLAAFLIIGAAPFLMGGTLPVLLRAVGAGRVGRAGATLYAANTGGAILGALLPAFVLIPTLGVQRTAWLAAGLNMLAAIGAWIWRRDERQDARGESALQSVPSSQSLPGQAWLAIILYAIAGAIALGYEVLWSQMIVPFMSTRAFAFSIVLTVYLAGLAIGAAVYARWEHRLGNPWRVFGLLIACAGVGALIELAILGRWLVSAQSLAEAAVQGWTESRLAGMSARFVVAASVIVLLPTLLLGAAFPAVLRIAVPPAQRGQGAGAVLAGNTLGGIAGTALTAFVLLPNLGTVRSLVLLALMACLVGLIAVWQARPVASMARTVTAALAIAVLMVGWALPTDHLARLLPGARNNNLVFYEENHGGTVAVVESGSGDHRFHRLYIQGVSNSGDAMPSLRYMRLQALLPLIVHAGKPRSALVIGYGTGITAGALSRYSELDQRVVAELLPGVLHAAPFFKGAYSASEDPGLDIRLRDGRRELLVSSQRYDLITLEPPPPSAAGVVNLYSRDFYALAAKRLNPQGIVAQWLPLPTQNLDDTRALVASFIDVFPHASLWTTELHEMLLVGSTEPLSLDAARIAERYAQPNVQSALAEVGISSSAALLATWVTDREGLARFADQIPAVTDDFPAIEYAPWVRPREILRTLPALLALRTKLPIQGADANLMAGIEHEREQLDMFYRSALAAYQGDRKTWARDAATLVQAAQDNAYLRWFIGGSGE